jgi:hypothetical protein
MELDQALEFAVVSAWEELVTPGEPCAIHVEYQNVTERPLNAVEVWMTKKRGYGMLVCRYSLAGSDWPAASPEPVGLHFANSYRSKTIAADLDFIMRNQSQFSRPPNRSVHGLIQVNDPNEEDRKSAANWSRSVRAASPLQATVAAQ